jgi:hypothetical protein
MEKWKQYKRKGLSEMREYVVGEDLSNVSVSDADIERDGELSTPGGMIARNPNCHEDQWYVAKEYFRDNFEEA